MRFIGLILLCVCAAAPVAQADVLRLIYLGAGGMYLEFGEDAIVGDPFFSNPPLWRVFSPLTIESDTEAIDRFFFRHGVIDHGKVRGLLVGHGHYDHAMDVPYIASGLPDSVSVFGNRTVYNQLSSHLPRERLQVVSEATQESVTEHSWVRISPRLRFLPIESGHAPNFFSLTLAERETWLSRRLSMAGAWKAGSSLSYAIEFRDDVGVGESAMARVFYQSAASDAPAGHPPGEARSDGMRYDVAILSAANWSKAQGYPVDLLRLINPRYVVFIHWERFWQPYQPKQERELWGLKRQELTELVRQVLGPGVPVLWPYRGECIDLALASAGPRDCALVAEEAGRCGCLETVRHGD